MTGLFKADRSNQVGVRSIFIGCKQFDSLSLAVGNSFSFLITSQSRKSKKNHSCRVFPIKGLEIIETLSNPNAQSLVL